MKRKDLMEEDVINWWLKKYHNTSIKKILEANPEWAADPQKHTNDFYSKYTVTQEQHDEWYEWFLGEVAKRYWVDRRYKDWRVKAKRISGFAYLNVAPTIRK